MRLHFIKARPEWLPWRRLALEGPDAGGLFSGGLGDKGVLARVDFKLFQLQLHLVEQAAGAFGAGVVLLAIQLGDLKLQWVISAAVTLSLALALASFTSASSAREVSTTTHATSASILFGKAQKGGDHEAE